MHLVALAQDSVHPNPKPFLKQFPTGPDACSACAAVWRPACFEHAGSLSYSLQLKLQTVDTVK